MPRRLPSKSQGLARNRGGNSRLQCEINYRQVVGMGRDRMKMLAGPTDCAGDSARVR